MATRIVGNQGTVDFGTAGGGVSVTRHNITASSWSMTISRVVTDVTPKSGATASEFYASGCATYSGSVTGFMDNTSAGEPFIDPANFNPYDLTSKRVYMTLTTATGCTYETEASSSGAQISGVSVSSSKTGDAMISFDFTFDGAPTESWDES